MGYRKIIQGEKIMSDFNSGINKATDIISGVARSLVTLLLSLFVLFVFAHVLFGPAENVTPKGWQLINPIQGLITLIKTFLNGSFTGLLALVFFVGFLSNSKWNG
jgi:hypothetical protein